MIKIVCKSQGIEEWIGSKEKKYLISRNMLVNGKEGSNGDTKCLSFK